MNCIALKKTIFTYIEAEYNTDQLPDRVVLKRSFRAFTPKVGLSGVITVILAAIFRLSYVIAGIPGAEKTLNTPPFLLKLSNFTYYLISLTFADI